MKTILVDAVNCFVLNENGIFKEMHALLETFPNPKIVLTGANDEEFLKFGLDRVPYPVFTLKHNPEKTNPAYYKTLLENLHLRPVDVIYFEHNPDAVKSAQSLGIKTHYYDSATKDLSALKAFLTKNLS